MRATSAAIVTLLAACGGDGADPPDAAGPDAPAVDAPAADAPLPGLTHTFPPHDVGPGEEVLGLCRSWTLGNDEPLLVSAVELAQTEALHSSSWYFVPESMYAGPDGDWRCSERAFAANQAVAAGGLLYVQSIGTATDGQTFAPGVALRIPPRARIVSAFQLLNATDATASGAATLTLRTADPATISVELEPFVLEYSGLAIPPRARSRFSGDCELASDLGGTLAARVHHVRPLTQALGTRVFAEVSGGPDDGRSLLDVAAPIAGASHDVAVAPPVDLAGATGLRFGCEYANPRDQTVNAGFGDQERCGVVGFIESTHLFIGVIDTADPAGTSGDLQLFTGTCATSATPR